MLVNIAALQVSCSGDEAANIKAAENAVRTAASDGANIILLPELFSTKYFCQEQRSCHFSKAQEESESPLLQRFSALARELKVVLPVSFFERAGQVFYNSVVIYDSDGARLGKYRKSHIPKGPGYQESFYFSPGDTGFQVFKTAYGRVGVGICWDQWSPEAARIMCLKGADLLLYPTAIGSEPDNPELDTRQHWMRVMQGHAAANMVPIVAANRVGKEVFASSGEPGITFYGNSFICDETGSILVEVGESPTTVIATFDWAVLAEKRAEFGLFRDRRPDLYGALLSMDGNTVEKDNRNEITNKCSTCSSEAMTKPYENGISSKNVEKLGVSVGSLQEQHEEEKLALADLWRVDMDVYLRGDVPALLENGGALWQHPDILAECSKVAASLQKYGAVLVADPRVDETENTRFLDLMETYFEQSDGVSDARPEFSYQVGVTPEGTERPRDHCAGVSKMNGVDKPASICPPEADPKWRFFWRVGPLPSETEFPALNAPPVTPSAEKFPTWSQDMNAWGGKMIAALFTTAQMAACGMGLKHDAFSSLMQYGPHLLAPTGSDLRKYGDLGTVLAGFHYDLNFMTIHGRSRYPGLSIWLRDGSKRTVKVPPGYLLVQAGKQLEYMTGGTILAGFHEVCVTSDTRKVITERTKQQQSLWRVSSTCFGHIASDNVLQPVAGLHHSEEALKLYPPIKAGHQVANELNAINLGTGYTLNRS